MDRTEWSVAVVTACAWAFLFWKCHRDTRGPPED